MEIVAQGTSWTELLANKDSIDAAIPEGSRVVIILDGPFPLPDMVLDAIEAAGNQVGARWNQKPYMSGNTLVLDFTKALGLAAILGAIGGMALSLAVAFLIGVFAWKVMQSPAQEVFDWLKWAIYGGLALGALLIVQGIIREPMVTYRGDGNLSPYW